MRSVNSRLIAFFAGAATVIEWTTKRNPAHRIVRRRWKWEYGAPSACSFPSTVVSVAVPDFIETNHLGRMDSAESGSLRARVLVPNGEEYFDPRHYIGSILEDLDQPVNAMKKEVVQRGRVKILPDEVLENVMSFLNGTDLARSGEVCRTWKRIASQDHLWQAICIKEWSTLDVDHHLAQILCDRVPRNVSSCWRKIFELITKHHARWNFDLYRGGGIRCSLIGHKILGRDLNNVIFPDEVNISHRGPQTCLHKHTRHDDAMFYLEPATANEHENFNNTIEYLRSRERVGLSFVGALRFIFIPPSHFARSQIGYRGDSLLCSVRDLRNLPPSS